jgi:hypothetical protein
MGTIQIDEKVKTMLSLFGCLEREEKAFYFIRFKITKKF